MFFNRPLETDDEFIAKIRKRTKNLRKISIFQFVLSFVLLAVSLFFLFIIFSGKQPGSFKGRTMWVGFSIGVLTGAIFAFSITMAISNFIDAVSNFKGRKEFHLLIKYYDKLNSSENL